MIQNSTSRDGKSEIVLLNSEDRAEDRMSGRINEILDKALRIAESIPDESSRSLALKSIAEALAEIGKLDEASRVIDEALRIAESIPDEFWRSLALKSIAEALAEIGKLDEALRIAESIPDKSSRSSALTSIAEALAEIGKLDEASRVIDEALRIAKSIPDEFWRSWALKSIAEALAEIGKLDEALRIAESIPNESSRSSALSSIARVMIEISAINIDILKQVLTEEDELEIRIESRLEIKNVLIEFEGVRANPVRMKEFKSGFIKVKPSFEPGKKKIRVKLTYEFRGKRYRIEREFDVEFKSSRMIGKTYEKTERERFLVYKIIELVGSGAFANVYKAVDDKGRVVALKIFKESEKAFIEEIGNFVQLTKRLQNVPYIVKPIDYGLNPKPFIVMDLYSMTLRDLIGKDIELKKKLRLMLRIARALSYAHSHKIYHGDLKPENILIFEEDGEYYPAIADWGGGFTPGYSAPEVYKSEGKNVDEKSDVYSFGVILYELVTGERLFSDPLDYVERCENVRVEMKDKKLEEIVNSCLSREDLRPEMREIAVKIADYLVVYLGTRYSRGLRGRDAIEIIGTYLDSGRIETAEKRIKAAESIIPREVFIVMDKIIELVKLVNNCKGERLAIPAEVFEQKYRGIIDLLDQETAKRIESDRFSPKVFVSLREIPPELQDSLLLCIDRMKDIVIGKYIKES